MDRREISLSDESRQLELSIEERRRRIDRTLEEIGDRLNPRSLLDTLLGKVHFGDGSSDRVKSGARAGAATVQSGAKKVSHELYRHLWPALTVAGGIAWWVFQERGGGSDDVGGQSKLQRGKYGSTTSSLGSSMARETSCGTQDIRTGAAGSGVKDVMKQRGNMMREKAEKTVDQLKNAGAGAKDMVGQKLSGVGQSMSRLTSGVKQRAQNSGEWSRGTFESSPMIIGAISVAAGFLLGALLPGTRREDELMGEPAERLRRDARDTGKEAVQTAVGTVREELHRQGGEIAEKTRDAASQITEAAKEGVERASDKLNGLAPEH